MDKMKDTAEGGLIKLRRWIVFLGAMSLILLAVVFSGFLQWEEDEEDKNFQKIFQEKYGIYALQIPDEIAFAGERVPLERFDVQEAFDQELLINTYWQSQTLLFIKRANRYFPILERILKEEGVPDDFKYLVLVESDLKNAVSPAGAVGIWQFLEGTAEDYGLEVNAVVDERYHIEKATRAACEYLKSAKEKFGTWTMAAAAYNMGRTGLIRQMNRQKENNYYDLLLNQETARYIYRILAVKLILNNPQKYGFHLKENDLYPVIPTFEVKVDTAVNDFAAFAAEYGITYKILKYFNPWLRDTYLKNPQGKTYFIKIPEQYPLADVSSDSIPNVN